MRFFISNWCNSWLLGVIFFPSIVNNMQRIIDWALFFIHESRTFSRKMQSLDFSLEEHYHRVPPVFPGPYASHQEVRAQGQTALHSGKIPEIGPHQERYLCKFWR